MLGGQPVIRKTAVAHGGIGSQGEDCGKYIGKQTYFGSFGHEKTPLSGIFFPERGVLHFEIYARELLIYEDKSDDAEILRRKKTKKRRNTLCISSF